MLRAMAALIGLAACGLAAAAPAPQSITASYNVYMNGAHVAVMNETFEARDGAYRIISESVPVGTLALLQKPVTAVSSGRVTAEGLRPERFEGRRAGSGQQLRAEFDWPGSRLTFGQDGKSETVALPPGTQDRLSIMYQFMYYALDQRERLDFAMTDGRRLTQHRYLITPNVDLDTALGRMATLHLVKQTAPDGSGTEIWLARQRQLLPVKVLINESNGTRYEQVITRVEMRNPSQ